MSKVVCYAQAEKLKSHRVMEAFCIGCAGKLAWTSERRLLDGECAFYGVRPPWRHLFDEAKARGRRFYYADNAWFDSSREKHFRIGVNALQSWRKSPSDGKRLARLGVRVQPWRKSGEHILVTPQSDEFMATLHGQASWADEVVGIIKRRSDRPVMVRNKGCSRPLAQDLARAWVTVAHSSAAAIESLIAGVPVIVLDENCAAYDFSGLLEDIETPLMPDGRLEFLGRLADSEFSLDQLRDGSAWKTINEWGIA